MIAATTHVDRFWQYVDGVASGEIPAGKWVRLAVERHIKDHDRQGTDDFPYVFNERLVERTCQFFPLCFHHSKGKWAGQPFYLAGWQTFIVGSLFGWVRETTADERSDRMPERVRRFRRALVNVARKNGKTTLAAGICLYMAVADAENVAEVYTAATKLDQAKLCLFAEAVRMAGQSSDLSRLAKVSSKAINFPTRSSYIHPIGSDKPFDGLSPHCVVLDEIHAFKELHRRFYETMKTGSGARSQPLLLSITTAGDEKSRIWREEMDYLRGVVEGSFADENVFGFLAEIDEDDDPFNPACWAKANPNIGESVAVDYIEEMAREAKAIPAKLNQFLRYHCNVMVSAQERAFDLDTWDECGGDLSDWAEADAICGGFDLGTRDDLAAFALCARFPLEQDAEGNPVYRYEFRVRAFISSQTERDLAQPPWHEFLSSGLLKRDPHVVSALRDAMIADCREHAVPMVAFDPYQAQQMAECLEQEGIAPVRMPQSYSYFSEPIQELQAALRSGRVSHGGDRLLRWCASNAIIVKDRSDRWMYDKSAASDKIDPIVALTMALKCVMAAKSRAKGDLFIF